MRGLALLTILCCAGAPLRAEIIDRIAARLDRRVVTLSEVRAQVRVAAFLNGETPAMDEQRRREAAARLIELELIQREMELSRYPLPSREEALPLLEQARAQRSAGPESWNSQLRRYGLNEEDLLDSLHLQLTILRFIEFRFRPGVTIHDREVEEYYRESFEPSWKRTHAGEPPPIEDSRAEIEEILTAARIDEALGRWLESAREGARIELYEEAFR